jgi:hypothetical protein
MATGNYERPAFTGSFWKPAKGTATLERQEKRQDIKKHERDVKEAVTKRDGKKVCRLDPNCPYVRKGIAIEGVHLDDKGMGGDHGVRTSVELMVRGCALHHRGPDSLHQGTRRVKYLTAAKANGLIALERNETHIDRKTGTVTKIWVEFAREIAINVWKGK